MKKILRLIPALVGISLFILSCGKEQPEQPKDVKVTDITLNSESLSLVEGDSQTLTATISPSNATNKKIVWSSSDASIASVDNGKVTAIKEGDATITAKSDDGGKTATCKVTVSKKEISVTGITLDNTSLNLIAGDETVLIATVLPEDATNKKVIWSSSDAQVVSVDEGKVKAIKEGEAIITAMSEDGGKTATCKVTVSKKEIPVTSITLDNTSLNLIAGDKTVLIATVLPEDATNKKVIWSSSDASIASVDNGKVTAIKEGEAIITAMSEDGGKTATCNITVTLPECICFSVVNENESNVLSIKNLNATLQYSYDGIVWNYWEEGEKLPFGNGKSLLVRGKNNNNGSGSIGSFILRNGSNVSCSGDIMYLMEYESHTTVITRNKCFKDLFYDCRSLTKAPELPATQLADLCYSYMFYGCTSLTQAPELPATQLAKSCYYNMFDGCTSLTQAPELPATQLAESCYCDMFIGCTSLTQAPELPATQLAESCYWGMFDGCTSLTQAPELPATQLAESCYREMFEHCTSLTQAPKLPATQLAKHCYTWMFSDCTSLTQAPELPATQLAASCYCDMFSGCTSLTQAPELPATQLAASCYCDMFSGCTSLTQAPELPATHVSIFGYRNMFAGCNSLSYVKAMFIRNNPDCLSSWLYGVSKTGTFVKNKAATWDNEGVVPSGWTVEYAEN